MKPDSASSTPPEYRAEEDAGLLPDMSRFEPASIGAWDCVWNSPYWFDAERDLEEGERVSVVVISDVSGDTLCRLTFTAQDDSRLKERWPADFAAQINGDAAVTPWLRAGYLDGDNVFHEGPHSGVLRLWCWGGLARIVCTAPFTGNLQPVLRLPDVKMDAAQTLWLQVRDRATQRVCETLEIRLKGEDWQGGFCADVNGRSDFLRAGADGEDWLTLVPAPAGCSIRMPQLAGFDVTLDPFRPSDETAAGDVTPLADPHGEVKLYDPAKLADQTHYRQREGVSAINLGDRIYVPVDFFENADAVTEDKDETSDEEDDGVQNEDDFEIDEALNEQQQSKRILRKPLPKPVIHFAVYCKMKSTASSQSPAFTGDRMLLRTESLRKLVPEFRAIGKQYFIYWDEKIPDSGAFFKILCYWRVFNKYTFDPPGSFNVMDHYLNTPAEQARDKKRKNIVKGLHQAFSGWFISYGEKHADILPLLRRKAPDASARPEIFYLTYFRDAKIKCFLSGNNVNIYLLAPLSGLCVFEPAGESTLPFSATVVSRQHVSHALPLKAEGFHCQRPPLSGVTSTLCEDAAFTLSSEAFDTSGQTENGVDPLTGLWHAHYPLANLQLPSDPRVRLDLTLHYAATRANEGALGDGWAFRRTSFDNRERRLTHRNGYSLKLSDEDFERLDRGERLVRGELTLSGTMEKNKHKFWLLEELVVEHSDGEIVTLGLPGNAEEAGEAFKTAVTEKLKKVNENLRKLLQKEEDIINNEEDFLWNGLMVETQKKQEAKRTANHYRWLIASNERQTDLYSPSASVLVPLRIARSGGGGLTLTWDGRGGHVRLLSVKAGETELLTAVHDAPAASGRTVSTFTVWPGTPEVYRVRLTIEDCLLKSVTRLPAKEDEHGKGGQTVSFGYCSDPLFDRLLDSVTGEAGARELITWKSGQVMPDGAWTLPEVLTRTQLPGGGGEALQEHWRWSGEVSLKARPGGRRRMTHVGTDGTKTVREWEYTDAAPRLLSVTETRPDGSGSTLTNQYPDDERKGNTAAHAKRQAVRTTVTRHTTSSKT